MCAALDRHCACLRLRLSLTVLILALCLVRAKFLKDCSLNSDLQNSRPEIRAVDDRRRQGSSDMISCVHLWSSLRCMLHAAEGYHAQRHATYAPPRPIDSVPAWSTHWSSRCGQKCRCRRPLSPGSIDTTSLSRLVCGLTLISLSLLPKGCSRSVLTTTAIPKPASLMTAATLHRQAGLRVHQSRAIGRCPPGTEASFGCRKTSERCTLSPLLAWATDCGP